MQYHSNNASLNFHEAHQDFLAGRDTPSAYLERCLETIKQREPEVKAWVYINEEQARIAAEQATKRYAENRPLSAIDGMPVGIKDIIETKDMPTQYGSVAYEGHTTNRDSAIVRALRDAGAIILGKTVTTAFALLDPGPTTNPYDSQRTPGGSSSGSAAAVAADMVPVTIGTQVIASVLRPSSYCGVWALKPTVGAFNRAEGLEFSQSHHGIHANSEIDLWNVASEVGLRMGGDPGYPGLYCERGYIPGPKKPTRLAVLQTEGWPRVDEPARQAFMKALDKLSAEGVILVNRDEDPNIEALEEAISSAIQVSLDITAWEHRWMVENLAESRPDAIGTFLKRHIDNARSQTLEKYRANLKRRADARRKLQALTQSYDACITLSATGIAPIRSEIENTRFPTGDLSMSCPASLLGAPSYNVPALQLDGMPLGVQVLGQQDWDERTLGYARWVHGCLTKDA